MPLKLRPTGLGSGADKDRPDYTVYSGEWAVGRIYETRGGPDNLRWFWSMTIIGPMTRSDRVATLEEAKAQLRKSWDAWKVGRGRIGWRDRRFLLPKSEAFDQLSGDPPKDVACALQHPWRVWFGRGAGSHELGKNDRQLVQRRGYQILVV